MALVIKRSPAIGARKGYVRQNHKYIKRIPLPNGKYRYIYTQDQLQSEQGNNNQAFKPGREKNPVNAKAKQIKVTRKINTNQKVSDLQKYFNKGKQKVNDIFKSVSTSINKVKQSIARAKAALERYRQKNKKKSAKDWARESKTVTYYTNGGRR